MINRINEEISANSVYYDLLVLLYPRVDAFGVFATYCGKEGLAAATTLDLAGDLADNVRSFAPH